MKNLVMPNNLGVETSSLPAAVQITAKINFFLCERSERWPFDLSECK